jgi:hypothetical protein
MRPGPLSGKTLGPSHLLAERGDDMGNALGEYSPEEIIDGLDHVSALWHKGLALFLEALRGGTDSHAREESDTAMVCGHSFRSAANFSRIYRLRRQWSDGMHEAYRKIVRDELANLQAVLPVLERDARFGYHIEAHGYQYEAAGVAAKIRLLQQELTLKKEPC